MQVTCPSCAATYKVPDNAIGPNGRRLRCRACDTSWREPGRPPVGVPPVTMPPATVAAPTPAVAPVVAAVPIAAPPPIPVAGEPAGVEAWPGGRVRRRRVPWLLLGLGALVVGLGALAATLLFGPDQVATRLGLADRRSPLGISITRPPDWRLIAGGSQLFAVSGRIWNPTSQTQPVPDIRAELKDRAGRTIYSWTIARPVGRLAPGASATFDGAAMDVPANSANVSVAFGGADPS